MSWAMSTLLHFFLSPGGPPVVFLVCVIWIARSRSAIARHVSISAALVYLAGSIYVVPAALARVVAAGTAPFEGRGGIARRTAIVLLGGGVENVIGRETTIGLMYRSEAARVLEAARVYAIVSPDWIVSSGGGYPDPRLVSSSSAMRDALVQLGVPASRIRLESASRNTRDEAVLVAPMLASLQVERVILVTSAIHMPRSLGAFRAAGVNAEPAAAPDPGAYASLPDRWLPTERGLRFSLEVVHELVGLPYYWLRGWWRV
jgi:uncharacterized SAM-binding protein YcdF (DUF218 family)